MRSDRPTESKFCPSKSKNRPTKSKFCPMKSNFFADWPPLLVSAGAAVSFRAAYRSCMPCLILAGGSNKDIAESAAGADLRMRIPVFAGIVLITRATMISWRSPFQMPVGQSFAGSWNTKLTGMGNKSLPSAGSGRSVSFVPAAARDGPGRRTCP